MGFFDKILKGLGFEEEEHVQKPKKTKKEKIKRVSAQFDLKTEPKTPDDTNNMNNTLQENEQKENYNNELNVIIIKNQIDVQMVINKLKSGQKALVNTGELNQVDLTRSLDFLTGAVFALNLSMQKVDSNIYIIQ